MIQERCWLLLPHRSPDAPVARDVILLSDTPFVVARDSAIARTDGMLLFGSRHSPRGARLNALNLHTMLLGPSQPAAARLAYRLTHDVGAEPAESHRKPITRMAAEFATACKVLSRKPADAQ